MHPRQSQDATAPHRTHTHEKRGKRRTEGQNISFSLYLQVRLWEHPLSVTSIVVAPCLQQRSHSYFCIPPDAFARPWATMLCLFWPRRPQAGGGGQVPPSDQRFFWSARAPLGPRLSRKKTIAAERTSPNPKLPSPPESSGGKSARLVLRSSSGVHLAPFAVGCAFWQREKQGFQGHCFKNTAVSKALQDFQRTRIHACMHTHTYIQIQYIIVLKEYILVIIGIMIFKLQFKRTFDILDAEPHLSRQPYGANPTPHLLGTPVHWLFGALSRSQLAWGRHETKLHDCFDCLRHAIRRCLSWNMNFPQIHQMAVGAALPKPSHKEWKHPVTPVVSNFSTHDYFLTRAIPLCCLLLSHAPIIHCSCVDISVLNHVVVRFVPSHVLVSHFKYI